MANLTAREIVEETFQANVRGEGFKADADKPRWGLLPWRAVEEIVKVFTFGARKYADDNWKKVPRRRSRYFDALHRHLYAYQDGVRNDPDSGLHHLAHAGCCLLMLLWMDLTNDQGV